MRLTPAYLTAVATFYDMFSTAPKGRHDVYVCTNISCSLLGADAIYERMLSAAGTDPDFDVKEFECLGACDIAPMASVDGEYVGPLEPDDCERIVDDVKAGREVLPGQAAQEARQGRDDVLEVHDATQLLYEDIDEPGLATLDGYSRARRLRDAAQGAADGAGRRAAGDARLGRPRPRRRRLRDGQEDVLHPQGRRWTSTSSATPTSPSPARSRTAS